MELSTVYNKEACKLRYVYKKTNFTQQLITLDRKCSEMAHSQRMMYDYYAKSVIIIESQILLLSFIKSIAM